MISIQNLTKYYDTTLAVKNISFEVQKGEVVGFLGPNGAGKTTTVRILTGFLAASSGTVLVDNLNIETDSLQIRRKIGYLPESAPLYLDMNVVDYIRFMRNMRRTGGETNGHRIKDVIEICGLGGVTKKNISELSKGYRQRVGLAQALIHDPEILVLDEPTVGLDPNQIIEIRNLVRKLAAQKTIILCSHILPEVEATCNRVLIINQGEIVADGRPDELQASFEGKGRLTLQIKNNPESFVEKIENIKGVDRVIKQNKINDSILAIDLETVKGTDPREEVFRLCIENNSILMEMKREETSLEDIFRQLTKKDQG